MSDHDQTSRSQQYSVRPTDDDGGAALFWALVVVVALGVFVFANFLGGSIPGNFASPQTTDPITDIEQTGASSAPADAAVTQDEISLPASDDGSTQSSYTLDRIDAGATYTSSD